MAESGHGLQIVSMTQDHRYILEERELERLLLREDVRDLPVVVVSVAGAYRGGRSFLLNFFLRYLSSPVSARQDGSWLGEEGAPLVGFQWRSGSRATTMGVLMWSEPFITTLPSGEKVAILLVDTQGNFNSESTVRDNSTIFALSTLVSSIQIFNLSHNIQEDDLQHLELFTEYGKLVNANTNTKAFQVLEFLVRDWLFPDEYPYGLAGGERLLREKLEITDDLATEMKSLREHIRSSFEKVSCFLMPYPGFKVLARTFKGNISDIDPDFRAQLKDLVSSIFGPEKLIPKKINGERVKARDLFNYFKTYMELFNSDRILSPTNILTATVKANLQSAMSEARNIYNKGMDSECGPDQLSVPEGDLQLLHEKYVRLARDAYINRKKMSSAAEISEHLDNLTKDLNTRLPQLLISNQWKTQIAMKNAKEAYREVIDNVSKDHLLCLHPRDLEDIHKKGVDAAMKIYDASRKRVTQRAENERKMFKESFQMEYDLQKKINQQNNTATVYEIKTEYWNRMQANTALDPPLSEFEFHDKHLDALNKALDEFYSRRNIPSYYAEDIYKHKLYETIGDYFNILQRLNHDKIVGKNAS